jgi:two-component system response regulator (stage 0 sporulation protein A)
MDRIKVIIAEDNREALYVMVELINGQPDMEVIGAFMDGKTAYNAICELKPDIIILDIVMPEMDGIEVLNKLKQDGNDFMTKIVISSERIEKQRKFAHGGFEDVTYFMKPFNFDVFIDRIKIAHDNKEIPIATMNEERMDKIDIPIEIDKMLKEFNIQPPGSRYIKKAMMLLIADENISVKKLCNIIAADEGTSWNFVHRKIRSTIETIYKHSTPDKFKKAFGKSNLGLLNMDLNVKEILLFVRSEIEKKESK